MLPDPWSDELLEVHIVSLGGGTVMVQDAINPSSVISVSLVKCRNIFPEVAMTPLGREVPVKVPRRTPDESIPSYTLNLSQFSSTLNEANVNSIDAEGTPEEIRKLQSSLLL